MNPPQGATWVYLVRDRNSGAGAVGASGAAADVYQEPIGDSLSSGSILWGNEHDSSENHSGSTSSTGSAGVGSARDGHFCHCVNMSLLSFLIFSLVLQNSHNVKPLIGS